MGLFDIFKKKEGKEENNKLSLEQILKAAATEPSYRPELYKRLMSDDLVVITKGNIPTTKDGVVEKDTQVSIISFPDGKIPVFTAIERIFDKGIIKEEVQQITLKGENLFNLAKGATFVLNPYSDFGKVLLPVEIERMILGINTLPHNDLSQVEFKKDTKIQIGQPAKYPTQIVTDLIALYSERPNIKAAYLGWILVEGSFERPHYVFGIEVDNDYEKGARETGETAKKNLPQDDFMDIVDMGIKSVISDYLKQTKPFYSK